MSGGTPSNLKRLAKRSVVVGISGRIIAERTRGVRRVLGRRYSGMGATHKNLDPERSADYIDEVFDDYLAYGHLERSDVAGKEILELGPGDNYGVALRFLAAGAAKVVAADRFIPYRDPEHQLRIYDAVLKRLDPVERERVGSVIDGGTVDFSGVGLEILDEAPIEDVPGIVSGRKFDLIVSRAVLEHVFDIDAAFDSMDQLLAPDGVMVHKVDLRDHGLFSEGGLNALTFLTIDDRVYRLMGEKTAGLPNRKLIDWYREKLASLGFACEFLITHMAGVQAEVKPHQPLADGLPDKAPLAGAEAIRSKLLPRYKDLPAEELAISGFMLVARRSPPAQSQGA